MPLSLLPWPSLRWTLPSEPRPAHPLPSSITRSLVSSGLNRKLELLTALPTSSSTPSRPPIFFLHGGFGGAFVWIEWMTYLQEHGYACYAVSLRGHGESWHPSFWRMTWGTGLKDLADDVECVWEEVLRREQKRRQIHDDESEDSNQRLPVLVGHSSGGGLAQYVLSEGYIRAEALVLCGAIPGTGGFGVHWNWAKMDPWFVFREYLHLMHPRSPLSSPALVKQAFFSPQFPRSKVEDWQRWMPEWESLRWPLGMMRQFVSFPRILGNIKGLSRQGARICIIAGSGDKLVGSQIPERLAKTFRDAIQTMVDDKKIDRGEDESIDEKVTSVDGVRSACSLGVRFVDLEGAPHHFQNDIKQEVGARQLLGFIDKLR